MGNVAITPFYIVFFVFSFIIKINSDIMTECLTLSLKPVLTFLVKYFDLYSVACRRTHTQMPSVSTGADIQPQSPPSKTVCEESLSFQRGKG